MMPAFKSHPKSALVALLMTGVIWTGALFADEDFTKSARAKDLRYGEMLFDYHQGHFFEALTKLAVARERGGIQNHGSHPLLIEGSLMLAYGMTREAKSHFEGVLREDLEKRVSAEVRNQAWFYLGKVFYLEGDHTAARQALEKVQHEVLEKDDAALFFEWRYLLAQIKLKNDEDDPLADYDFEQVVEQNDIWPVYALLNQAAFAESNGSVQYEKVIAGLSQAIGLLDKLAEKHGANAESTALRDQILLSLGQVYIQSGAYQEASDNLKRISYESPASDKALFYFAVAQSHLGNFELALSALNRLSTQPLFTPWLQQVPYALAYLYEQLGDTALSVQAYSAAGDHYDRMLDGLEKQKEDLDERVLLTALELPGFPSVNEVMLPHEAGIASRGQPLMLGGSHAENDAFGRLKVRPADFYIAELLATEPFQLALRDLHELYKLQTTLSVWNARIDAFEFMLATRAQQREARLSTVKAELESIEADKWQSLYESFSEQIGRAVADENAFFFMDETQMDYAAQLNEAKATLALLPDGEDKDEFAQKLDRIERFFRFWVTDRYGVNRWSAQKQLKQLEAGMKEFDLRRQFLEDELDNTRFQHNLDQRVATARASIPLLLEEVSVALESARANLISLVHKELERQKTIIIEYRLLARHAQARLGDELYRLNNRVDAKEITGSANGSSGIQTEGAIK